MRAWSTARATSQIARQMRSRVPATEPGLVQSLRFAVESPTTARPVLEPAGGAPQADPPAPAAPILTWASLPGAVPSFGISARVGDAQARSVASFDAGSWHHVAATFTERSAVRIAHPSARLESTESALDLTGDLTLEVDLWLEQDSPAGVLVSRGTASDVAAGLPYELSLTSSGTLRFRGSTRTGRPARPRAPPRRPCPGACRPASASLAP